MYRQTRRPDVSGAPSVIGRSSLVWVGLLFTVSCASYERAPLDPSEVLARLRATAVPEALTAEPGDAPSGEASGRGQVPSDGNLPRGPFDPSDGLSIDEAVALATHLNPDLRATRAELDVATAQLVRAGWLPDPTLGWDFNEENFVVRLPLLRPDERGAKRAGAEARLDEARWTVLAAEWRLGREVHLAILELLGARERVRLNEQLAQVVSLSLDFFARARAAGAVLALDQETASIQAARIQIDAVRLTAQEERARLALNALLGLPPATEVQIEEEVTLSATTSTSRGSPSELTDQAITSRPDVAALMAVYEQAESKLRLEVARQWPQLAIGTSVALTLGVFTDFNDAAIRAAAAERERVGHLVTAAVHDVRAEVHDALVALRQSRSQLDLFEMEIAPRLDESLRLVDLSVQSGQATASQILLAQGQVLEARVQLLDAQIEAAKRAAVARWVTAEDMGESP